jgi:hypothetical protein
MDWGEFDISWISAGYHAWKPVWGGHRKASNIHVEVGDEKHVKILNCHTRLRLRNCIFIPEFTRIKKEMIENGREDLNRLFASEKIGQKAIEDIMSEDEQKRASAETTKKKKKKLKTQ